MATQDTASLAVGCVGRASNAVPAWTTQHGAARHMAWGDGAGVQSRATATTSAVVKAIAGDADRKQGTPPE